MSDSLIADVGRPIVSSGLDPDPSPSQSGPEIVYKGKLPQPLFIIVVPYLAVLVGALWSSLCLRACRLALIWAAIVLKNGSLRSAIDVDEDWVVGAGKPTQELEGSAGCITASR